MSLNFGSTVAAVYHDPRKRDLAQREKFRSKDLLAPSKNPVPAERELCPYLMRDNLCIDLPVGHSIDDRVRGQRLVRHPCYYLHLVAEKADHFLDCWYVINPNYHRHTSKTTW